MEWICHCIEARLTNDYLLPNNISVEDFSMPTEENAWTFFRWYCVIKMEEPDSAEESIVNSANDYAQLSDDEKEIMTIISQNFYDEASALGYNPVFKDFQDSDGSHLEAMKSAIIKNTFI